MATTVASNIDIADVWNRFKADISNVDLRNILIERYMPLVKFNGERLRAKLPEGVELDDLISAGIFGLMDAIDAFDMERGVKFETYCVPRIRGAMLDEGGGPRAERARRPRYLLSGLLTFFVALYAVARHARRAAYDGLGTTLGSQQR